MADYEVHLGLYYTTADERINSFKFQYLHFRV